VDHRVISAAILEFCTRVLSCWRQGGYQRVTQIRDTVLLVSSCDRAVRFPKAPDTRDRVVGDHAAASMDRQVQVARRARAVRSSLGSAGVAVGV
jgi:hypothetical protein